MAVNMRWSSNTKFQVVFVKNQQAQEDFSNKELLFHEVYVFRTNFNLRPEF